MPAEGDDLRQNGSAMDRTDFDTFKIEERSPSTKENGHAMFGYQSFDNNKQAPTDGIPWFFGAMIFINALVGAGILNFPYSIHAAGGIYVAVAVQMIMVTLLFCSVTCVIWCSHLRGTTLYQDTVSAYLGPTGKYICSVTMLVYCFLITTTYLIAIGEQLSAGARIVSVALTEHPLASKQFLVIGVSLIVILPFCLVKHIDRLHFASGLASITVVMVAVVVVYEYHRIDTSDVRVVTSPAKWTNVFLSVPAYAIAYMFDLASVAVYGRMRPRTVGSFMKAASIALVSVFCFYNIFAGYAYYTFGDKIKPNFMANYVEGTWVIAFAQFAYSLKLCLEYPIYQFLGWTALRSLVNALGGSYCAQYLNEERNAENVDRFRLMTSLLWIFSTMSVAFFAPDISYVLPLASAAVLHFQFTFPGLCILSAVRSVGNSMERKYAMMLRAFALFIIAFGFGMSGILVYQTIKGSAADAS
uniref:Amino acid transporter transmembrane domain-containing protein n=1 Tax=Plectus sambesii TaxID=2011161 RepID=A0A914W9R7_9BILA